MSIWSFYLLILAFDSYYLLSTMSTLHINMILRKILGANSLVFQGF